MNNNQTDESKPRLTNEQKEKLKKYAVFFLMAVICAGCMWLIFAPSADEKAKQEAQAGFNADIPMPKEEGIIDNKKDAYERGDMKKKQDERMRSLQDFSALLGNDGKKPADDLALLDEPVAQKNSGGYTQNRQPQSSIQTSAQAYHDINRTLGNFYETPKADPEKERLAMELDEMKARLDEQDNRKKMQDEQMTMMEKSFQMASKYMPMNAAGTTPSEPANVSGNNSASGKIAVVPVSRIREQTVSALQQEMSGTEFIEAYGQARNMGFLTATAETNGGLKNTISACVHGNQTILDGQSVRLRLLEPVHAGNVYIPRNTLVSGTAKIQGERLDITVNSMENTGTILPIDLMVYDLDGQRGLFIPDLQELNAAKEIVANMGTSAGTSINLSNDAEKQFIADMGRNLIQGVSQFTSKKLREVKVHLKEGYKVYLLSETQLKNKPALANK
jgi:conjugative transposon TraM protein